jgi:hypothetical protein
MVLFRVNGLRFVLTDDQALTLISHMPGALDDDFDTSEVLHQIAMRTGIDDPPDFPNGRDLDRDEIRAVRAAIEGWVGAGDIGDVPETVLALRERLEEAAP